VTSLLLASVGLLQKAKRKLLACHGSRPRSGSDYYTSYYFLPNRTYYSDDASSFILRQQQQQPLQTPIENDPVLNEIVQQPPTSVTSRSRPPERPLPLFTTNVTRQHGGLEGLFLEEEGRGKRGAFQLALMMNCATGCDPLSYRGYGCFCGFAGAGDPMDEIDMCCKMHDWCYSTSSCEGLAWHLPYFVPFKWKCNGGAPYCIPGKTSQSGRNSCSHQLCECDRQFAMCLNHHLPCPRSKVACRSPQRIIQGIVDGITASANGLSGAGNAVKKKKNQRARNRPRNRRPSVSVPRKSFRNLPFPFANFG